MLSDRLQKQQDEYIESYKNKIKGARDFRVDVVAKLILDGKRSSDVIKFLGENWGYCINTCEKYMKDARERLREINKPGLEDNLAVAITQINDLISESKKDKDENGRYNRREVHDYVMSKAKLQRLLDPKMEVKGDINLTIPPINITFSDDNDKTS